MELLTLFSVIVAIVGLGAGIIQIVEYFEQKRNGGQQPISGEQKTTDEKAENRQDLQSSLPRISYFFGREEELERINNALSPDIRGWGVLIDGPGGIGKTTLAIYAAQQALNEDFPIKVFLSAQNRKLTLTGVQTLPDFVVPDYVALLTELGRQLGEKGIEKLDPSQRAKCVYEVLQSKKVLIVIDGVENFDIDEENRLFEFLHRLPNSCKAIATSRRRNGHFADIIRLDRLSFDAAEALISKLSQNRPLLKRATATERRMLYEIAGGNPLLIEWVTGQLGRAQSRCRTIEDACKLLESASSGEQALEYVFGDQLATLVESETKILAILTYFTAPIKKEWLGYLTKLPPTSVDLALENLSERTMLAASNQSESVLILPLAANFLRRAHPSEINEAGQSLSKFVLKLVEDHGFKKYDQFHILDDFWPIIVASFSVFIRGSNATLQLICKGLFDFLDFYGYWDDYLNLVSTAEAVAVKESDFVNAGWRVYDSGFIYLLRGQTELLEECVHKAEEYFSHSSERERSYVHRLRGWLFSAKKDYSNALKEHTEFVETWRVIDPLSHDYIKGLSSQAFTERNLGEFSLSQEHYEQVLTYATSAKDYRYIAVSKSNLAFIALNYKKWDEAEVLAREALSIFEGKIYKKESIGLVNMRLAQALLGQNCAEEALAPAQKSFCILRELRAAALKDAEAVLNQCLNKVESQETP